MASSPRSSERPLNIVYRVRGRSASPLDGIWAATIDVGDLPSHPSERSSIGLAAFGRASSTWAVGINAR